MKHEPKEDGKGAEANVYVQTKDRTVIHLEGQEAEQLLRLLIRGIPASGDAKAWEEAMKRRLTSKYGLQDGRTRLEAGCRLARRRKPGCRYDSVARLSGEERTRRDMRTGMTRRAASQGRIRTNRKGKTATMTMTIMMIQNFT